MTTAPEPATYVGIAPCGCLNMAVVDIPEKREVAKAIAQAVRYGDRIERWPTQQVREYPWKCQEHKKEVQP